MVKMKIYFKFDYNALCNNVLSQILQKLDISATVKNFGEADLQQSLPPEKLAQLEKKLADFGIEMIENPKHVLVQKIKDAIVHMVHSEEQIHVKASVYLAEKLGHSYGYISNIFSEITHTSIENFIIIQKIEYAKQLLISEDTSLTEVANRLSYSSVAHLSTQFKNTTGITPTQFQKILKLREQSLIQNS